MPNISGVLVSQAHAQTDSTVDIGSLSADGVLNALRGKMDQNGWFCDVSHEGVKEIISKVSKENLNEAFSKLSNSDLKSWLGEVNGWYCGLSYSDRIDLCKDLAEKLNAEQQVRVFNALETKDQKTEFASNIKQAAMKPGLGSTATDFAAELAKGTQSKDDFTEQLDLLLKNGYSPKEVYAFTSNNQHRDKVEEMQILHQYGDNQCITTMVKAYQRHYGDPALGTGIGDLKHANLMPQMVRKGYATEVGVFTFDNSRFTLLKNVTQMTKSLADRIKALGPGVYSLGVADGGHTMTLTYDGSTFKLHDQGTGWDTSYTNGADLDAQMVNITKGLARYLTEKNSSELFVYRLK